MNNLEMAKRFEQVADLMIPNIAYFTPVRQDDVVMNVDFIWIAGRLRNNSWQDKETLVLYMQRANYLYKILKIKK